MSLFPICRFSLATVLSLSVACTGAVDDPDDSESVHGAVAEEPADWGQSDPAVRCTYRMMREYMSRSQRAQGFSAHRTTRVGELRYFRPNDPNFLMIISGITGNLLGCMQDLELTLNEEWTTRQAGNHVARTLSDRDSRLVDVASDLRQIFDQRDEKEEAQAQAQP
jgi:hypothetical protein